MYIYGILFQKNFWPTVRKKENSRDQEKLLKFEAEGGQKFAKKIISLEQFIQIVTGQNNFWNEILVKVIPGCFSDIIYIIKIKKKIGIQKPTVKVG